MGVCMYVCVYNYILANQTFDKYLCIVARWWKKIRAFYLAKSLHHLLTKICANGAERNTTMIV